MEIQQNFSDHWHWADDEPLIPEPLMRLSSPPAGEEQQAQADLQADLQADDA